MGGEGRKILRWIVAVGFAATILPVPLAIAQVTIGENLNMRMDGSIGAGYSGAFGDYAGSHGIFATGQGQLAGSYYNPNFLNFNVQPFYNRNQDNSTFASVLNETGVMSTVNLFGGSHFPGSVSYGYRADTGSTYGFLGPTGLNSNSVNQDFSVTWGVLLPNLPTVNATFSDNTTNNTILGLPGTADSSVKTFNLVSTYKIDGFLLSGFYSHQNTDVTLPEFISPTNQQTTASYNVVGLSTNHRLPYNGSFQADYNHTGYSSDTGLFSNSGTTNMVDGSVSFAPTQNFTFGVSTRYTTNLLGALQETLVPGGVPILISGDQNSHALNFNEYATYYLGHGIMLTGFASTQQLHYLDGDSTNNQFGGTVTYNYSKPLFGMLTLSFGMTDGASGSNGDTTPFSGNNGLGFVGAAGLRKIIRGWDINADFTYTQSVQTSIGTLNTSNYSYGGNVRRLFGADTHITASYRGIQNGISQYLGYSNRSDSVLVVLNRRWYGISGSYGRYKGTSLLTIGGALEPTPLAPILPIDQVFYNGISYGAGVNVSPLRRMVILANWYRIRSDTESVLVNSQNNTDRIYAQAQYTYRQLQFRAGYYRAYQLITSSSLPGATSNTYYFNVTRWFNLF